MNLIDILIQSFKVDYLISLILIISILSILVIKAIPSLNILLQYGKTLTLSSTNLNSYSYIENLSKLTVPKKWFLHFYIIYFTLCINLGFIILLLSYSDTNTNFIKSWWKSYIFESNNSLSNLLVIYYLIFFQSIRRLYESIYITKFSSTARINIAHYLVGMMFYITITLNTFISIIPQFLFKTNLKHIPNNYIIQFILILIFIIASFDQFFNHYYLALLKKYTVPTNRLFKYLAAPHYFDEIIIYLIIAILSCLNNNNFATKLNYWLSFTFVLVNLTISSIESNNYYKRQNVGKQWSIIPFII